MIRHIKNTRPSREDRVTELANRVMTIKKDFPVSLVSQKS